MHVNLQNTFWEPIYNFTTLYKILNKISYCPQECLQHGAELTRKLAEAEEKVVATQDVVAICTETMGSLSEVVAMVDGDSVVICLAVYTALSLLWTVARLTHIWWTGPTGGLWLTDIAHHHLALSVLFIFAGHMYRTNWGQ